MADDLIRRPDIQGPSELLGRPGRTILAAFQDRHDADRAVDALRRKGFEHVEVSVIEGRPHGQVSRADPNRPFGITFTGESGPEARHLVGTDPDASGVALGPGRAFGGQLPGAGRVLVTVLCEADREADAAHVLRETGALF